MKMKKVLILLFLCLGFALQAQDTLEHWSDTYYYKPLKEEIPSLQFKLVNQSVWDNVVKKNRNTNIGVVSVPQTYDVDFFKLAKKVRINYKTNGYVLHVKAQDALQAFISVTMMLHDSTSIFVYDTSGNQLMKRDSRHNLDKDSRYNGRRLLGTYGNEKNEVIIIFHEPKKYKNKSSIQIKRILWGDYVDQQPEAEAGLMAKTASDNCKAYITCHPKEKYWRNRYKSVVQLSYLYEDGTGMTYTYAFSGFLLNTTSNFNKDMSEEPYLMTCLHCIDEGAKYGITLEDVFEWTDNNRPESIRIRYNYARRECGKPNEIDPQLILNAKFKILEKGNRKHGQDWEEDYLFLQFDGTTYKDILDDKDVVFAGWKALLSDSHSYARTSPSYSFHHGIIYGVKDDNLGEMRYAIDHDYAYPNKDNTIVRLTYEEGSFNKGGSGSPIFEKDYFIIGMNAFGDNASCGQGIQPSSGGPSFASLYKKANLKQYLGDQRVAFPFPILAKNMPEHCNNCVTETNLGEDLLNCGGPCFPCKYYNLNEGDLQYSRLPQKPMNITAQGEVKIGKPGSIADVITDNLNVSTKGGITIQKNTEFKAGTEVNLAAGAVPYVIERPKDGFDGCIKIANYLVYNEVFKITFKGIERFHIAIHDENNKKFSSNASDVLFDGLTDVWDSRPENINTSYRRTFFYYLDMRDTKGVTHHKKGFFHYLPKDPLK